MITAGQMVDDVLGELAGWTLDEEQSTTLAADIGSTDLTFTVTANHGIALGVSPGILEIDSELFYCSNVTGNTVTIEPWGRGHKSTVATSHAAGARVVSQPTFPRAKVLDAMNQILNRIYPDVYAVKSIESTTTFPQITYPLPSDAEWLLNARWQVPDGRRYWETVDRWRMSPGGGTQFGDQGRTVDIADSMIPGRPLQILYAARPGALVSESDSFETVTGLDIAIRDVVTLGAATQMLPQLELSRLQMSSVEQQNRAQLVAPSAALTATNALERRFEQRLAEERRSLQRLYPPRVTGVWK